MRFIIATFELSPQFPFSAKWTPFVIFITAFEWINQRFVSTNVVVWGRVMTQNTVLTQAILAQD